MIANNQSSSYHPNKTIELTSVQATKDFAINIASSLKIGDILAIKGDMGAGKTTLCSAIINYFFSDVIATSPTFNLVNVYSKSDVLIHHYDLYRLSNYVEALNIGIEESFSNSITLIEWPDIIKPILPKDIITIEITTMNNNRYISFQDNRNI